MSSDKERPNAPSTIQLSGQESRRPIVLVVDDAEEILILVEGLLSAAGKQVLCAGNGQDALRLAQEDPTPDLILLDIMMPGMDGYQLLSALKQNPKTSPIPVIFVTALIDTGDEERCLSLGAVDFINKPITPSVLLARVQAQLDLKHARDLMAVQKEWLEQEVTRRIKENDQLQTHLQLALDAADFGVWEQNLETGENIWSDALCRLFGSTSGPATITEFFSLVHPEDRPFVETAYNSAIANGNEFIAHEFRMRHEDGHWLWVEARGRCQRSNDEARAERAIGIMSDISTRKAADADRQLASVVINGISDCIFITDVSGRIILVNPAFTAVTGYAATEAIGRKPDLLRSGVHGPAFYQDMWEKIHSYGNWQGEITNRRKDGSLYTEWLSISAVRDSNGNVVNYVSVFSDLSERKAAAERIQYLSNFDALTGLPNRNLFTDRLDQAILTAHRFGRGTAVILLDLNRFRTINDSLGLPAGDLILGEVSRRLALQLRDGDTVGRRSSNEFGFVMANLAQERDAMALAQRILEAIAAPITVDNQTLTVTASLGLSIFPKDGQSSDALLKCADAALIRAKQAGRHSFRFYSPEMDADAARRLQLEAGLRVALERNELSVYYQPQTSLTSGNLIGMEALLRWHGEALGPVSPVEFIPIAEETGLIVDIGTWVLRTACLQTRQWLDLGFTPLRVAVNLSARQFRQKNLPEIVGDILAESGLPASALELEITESAFIDDIEEAIVMCRKIKSLGIKLSLDDFGTGYSSLAYISRFPFDKLKIDQSFVRDITENPVNAAIASAAIVLARSLNVSVLAEGVETEAQASFLRSRRCDAIQGYLFSRPLPANDFGTLLASKRRMTVSTSLGANTPTLLLVDDEPHILAALGRLFRRDGYQVLTAQSPAEGFEVMAKNPVQVVLCDQRMPEMSGTDFLTRVRHLYPNTVRIVLTAYTDLESVTDAINRGAVYKFLTKPWDDDQLREQIREAFRIAHDLKTPSSP